MKAFEIFQSGQDVEWQLAQGDIQPWVADDKRSKEDELGHSEKKISVFSRRPNPGQKKNNINRL